MDRVAVFVDAGYLFAQGSKELWEARACYNSLANRRRIMTANTFDTLAAARDLEAAGFTREQAETAVKAMRDAASASRTDLATRADLYQVALGIVIANAAITFGLVKLL